MPSHDAVSRGFRLLDPERFHAWFVKYVKRFAETCEGVAAIDGKTLRRSHDRTSERSPLHLVNAWAADRSLVLGQLAVDGNSNGIVAIPKPLELLSLKGRTASIDAIGCQRDIARAITGPLRPAGESFAVARDGEGLAELVAACPESRRVLR